MTQKNDSKIIRHPDDNSSASCRIEIRECGAEVAWIEVGHPKKMNAIGSAMMADLGEIFTELKTNNQLRVVVISGAGERAFVGGAFLPELDGLTPQTGREFITRLHLACQAVRDCPVPVIARVKGYCLGAGVELAASCDFRVRDS